MQMSLVVSYAPEGADEEEEQVTELDVEGYNLTLRFDDGVTTLSDDERALAFSDGVNPGWWVLDVESEHKQGLYGLVANVRGLRVSI